MSSSCFEFVCQRHLRFIVVSIEITGKTALQSAFTHCKVRISVSIIANMLGVRCMQRERESSVV